MLNILHEKQEHSTYNLWFLCFFKDKMNFFLFLAIFPYNTLNAGSPSDESLLYINKSVQEMAKKFDMNAPKIFLQTTLRTQEGSERPRRRDMSLIFGNLFIGDYLWEHLTDEELEFLIAREFVHCYHWHRLKKIFFICAVCCIDYCLLDRNNGLLSQGKDCQEMAAGLLLFELLMYIRFVINQERFADKEALKTTQNPQAFESAYKKTYPKWLQVFFAMVPFE
ncbi:MAG: hypothetical protein WC707_00680 [Candidatus Babeliaceae bacterium]|jgi:hypothetical protein